MKMLLLFSLLVHQVWAAKKNKLVVDTEFGKVGRACMYTTRVNTCTDLYSYALPLPEITQGGRETSFGERSGHQKVDGRAVRRFTSRGFALERGFVDMCPMNVCDA